MAEPVKGKSEAGRRREESARHRRQRVVDAALRLFLERGYAAATIEAIAREAGVAPATVYQAFGTKQAILARVLDVTVAGDAGPAALLDRDWVNEARQDPEPRRRLAIVVQRASEVAARTAPIKEVMRDAAAADPAVRQLLREDNQRRYLTQQALVDIVIGAGSLRAGCDRERAVASFFALVNSHSYQLLTEHLGWGQAAWERWLIRVLGHELFGNGEQIPDAQGAAGTPRRPGQARSS
jgi:AcrR family transcriptional regulator